MEILAAEFPEVQTEAATIPPPAESVFSQADVDDLIDCFRETKSQEEPDDLPVDGDEVIDFEEFSFQLVDQPDTSLLVSFDGIESEDDIRATPDRLLTTPFDKICCIEHHVAGRDTVWLIDDWHPKKRRYALAMAERIKKAGGRVVWLRWPANHILATPPKQDFPWYTREYADVAEIEGAPNSGNFDLNRVKTIGKRKMYVPLPGQCVCPGCRKLVAHKVICPECKVKLPDLPGKSDRIEVTVDHEEFRVVDEVCRAFSTSTNLYQRSGQLVRITQAGTIHPLAAATVRERITKVVDLLPAIPEDASESEAAKPRRPKNPPPWLVPAVMARGHYGLHELVRVAQSPFVRPDGTICFRAGYDAATQTYLFSRDIFPMPYWQLNDVPSSLELATGYAKHAAAKLNEILLDFPFDDPKGEEPFNRSAMLAAMVTLFARSAYTGCTPIIIITKNAPGTGAGLAVDCAAVLATGRQAPRQAVPSDDTETRKLITSTAIEAATIKLLDNAVGAFGCASLDAAATSTTWTDRILGRSEIVTYPWNTTLFVTANNISIRGDTARRVLPIKLRSPEQNPEERRGFTHPNLLEWIEENRPQLAMDACMLLAAYIFAGRPDMGLHPWGSFEGWSNLVRNAIVFAGWPDPCGNRATFRKSADSDSNTLPMLIAGIEELIEKANGGKPLTAAKIISLVKNSEATGEFEILRNVLAEFQKDGKPVPPRSLGSRLHHAENRICENKWIAKKDGGKLGALWFIQTEGDGSEGDSGKSSDSNYNPSRKEDTLF